MEPENTLTLNEDLTIKRADYILNQLVSALKHQNCLRIVVDRPENLDLTFIQLLIATQKQAKMEGKQLEIAANLGDELVDLLERAGLNHCLKATNL